MQGLRTSDIPWLPGGGGQKVPMDRHKDKGKGGGKGTAKAKGKGKAKAKAMAQGQGNGQGQGKPTRRKARVDCKTATEARLYLSELVYYLIDSLLSPLLRTTFYVTESGVLRNRVLYFRQDDWAALSAPLLAHMGTVLFSPIPRREAIALMSMRKLGYAHVRLRPKNRGVRPIVNLKRRSVRRLPPSNHELRDKTLLEASDQREAQLQKSINQVLDAAFHVLSYEKAAQSERFASSVLGPNDIQRALRDVCPRLRRACADGKRVYAVKVDVKGAFDTIEHGPLLRLLESIVANEAYYIRPYSFVAPAPIPPTTLRPALAPALKSLPVHEHKFGRSTAGLTVKYKKAAVPDWAMKPFDEWLTATDGAAPVRPERPSQALPTPLGALPPGSGVGGVAGAGGGLRSAVVTDSVYGGGHETRAHLLSLIKEHITGNLVKMGREFFCQRVGIPQGSRLSTLLCSFFYAQMEWERLGFLREGQDQDPTLLMRYTDDFLLLTTDGTKAHRFLDTMRKGHEEYGCFISDDKTRANFAHRFDDGTLVPAYRAQWFPWCGYLVGTGPPPNPDPDNGTGLPQTCSGCISSKTVGAEDVPLGAGGRAIPGEVRWEFNRAAHGNVYDSLTVSTGRNPGAGLATKLWRSLGQHSHGIFHDPHLSRPSSAARTTYAASLDAAMKFHAHLMVLQRTQQSFSDAHARSRSRPHEAKGEGKAKIGRKNKNRSQRAMDKSRRAAGLFHLILRGVEFRAQTVTTVANRTRRSLVRAQQATLSQLNKSTDSALPLMSQPPVFPSRSAAQDTTRGSHTAEETGMTSTIGGHQEDLYLDRTFLTFLSLDAFRRVLSYKPSLRAAHGAVLRYIERFLRQSPHVAHRRRWGSSSSSNKSSGDATLADRHQTCRRALRLSRRFWSEHEPIVATIKF